jgi:glutamyl-tRNA synthetase
MTPPVRTRIAPSPTGFLHLGTARTALYSWAYARHHGGQFVLRIEDTDVARSTQDSVDQILASMRWLGLDYDEGPIYQMQRLERYHAVVEQMIAAGTAYRCWCTPAELDADARGQRAAARRPTTTAAGARNRARCCRGALGVKPVVRFRNPLDGVVTWDDLVKGPISIATEEIDDLIIARGPKVRRRWAFRPTTSRWWSTTGTCGITHVFRGDEHINNTPWQINIFQALGAPLPQFGHCPIILGEDGLKLSKRRGAVSVTAYEENGYLPEAMLNYLARLGWSHGDDELFSREQMVQWFDGSHLNKSPAQWDPAKLAWVNAHYMKQADDAAPGRLVAAAAGRRAGLVANDRLARRVCALQGPLHHHGGTGRLDRRCICAGDARPKTWRCMSPMLVRPALLALRERLAACDWDKAGIDRSSDEGNAGRAQLKMPQLAMPVRVLVCGRTQTPSLDAVLALFDRSTVLARLQHV